MVTGTEKPGIFVREGTLIATAKDMLRLGDVTKEILITTGKQGLGKSKMLRLLATDGMLVKRPLLVGDDFVLVGFKEAEWESRLKTQ